MILYRILTSLDCPTRSTLHRISNERDRRSCITFHYEGMPHSSKPPPVEMSEWDSYSPSDDEKSTDCSSSETMLEISQRSTPASRQEAGSSSRSSSSSESTQLFDRYLVKISNSKELRMREVEQFKGEIAKHKALLAWRRRNVVEQNLSRRSGFADTSQDGTKPYVWKELQPGRYSPSRAPTPSPPPYRRQPPSKLDDKGNLTAIYLMKFRGRKSFKNPSDEYLEYFADRSPARTVQHRTATTRAAQTTDHLEALKPSDRTFPEVAVPNWFAR